MDKTEIFQKITQNKTPYIAAAAVVVIFIALAALYFLDLLPFLEKKVGVFKGTVVSESLVVPDTEKVFFNDGRFVNQDAYRTPLVPKSEEEEVVVAKAKLTLKGSYDVSAGEAGKWSKDAKLVFIKSLGAVTLEGKSSQWQIIFGSKNKKSGYEIVIQGDKTVSQKEIKSDSFGYDLPKNWYDSGEAIVSLQTLPQFSNTTVSAINFFYDNDSKWWMYAVGTSGGNASMFVK